MNKLTKIATVCAIASAFFVSTGAAVADEVENKQVSVFINKNDDAQTKVDLKVNEDSTSFELPDMQSGESQTITTDKGETATITKTDKGYVVNIAGEEIDIPLVSGDLSAHLKNVAELPHMNSNQVLVSGVSLDDNQKEIIKQAFVAAGIDKDVSFSNANIMVFDTDSEAGDGKMHTFQWKSDDGTEIIKDGKHQEIRKEVIILKKEDEDK